MSFEIREMFIDELGFQLCFDIEHILWPDENNHLILSECFNIENTTCGVVVFEKDIR